jgi:hypothetical protein
MPENCVTGLLCICLQKTTTTREDESSVLSWAGADISTVSDMVVDRGMCCCGVEANKSGTESSLGCLVGAGCRRPLDVD